MNKSTRSMFALLFAISVTLNIPLIAQTELPLSSAMTKAYAKGTRSQNGKPGRAYWQNKAIYTVDVSFNPETRLLRGVIDMQYVNNSPDTLQELWLKLYPNLYTSKAPRKAEINDADLGNGVSIAQMEVDRKSVDVKTLHAEGTNMRIAIDPLLPGKQKHLKIVYQYTLNAGSSVRTGQVEEGTFFIAYFFPRIAVYDDIDGWNKQPYNGSAEFYNDFCDFRLTVSVPEKYVVWATGDLMNQDEVFSSQISKRLSQAEETTEVIDVITPQDIEKNLVTKRGAVNTWKFEAQNVTDVSFAISNRYVMQSTSVLVDSLSGRRARVDAVFNPRDQAYNKFIGFASNTVVVMSHTFPKIPYPYSHITVFGGIDEMEYPMMVNANPVDRHYDALTLVIHEIFHTIFPFYVGTNETKHGWMDEGWAALSEWIIAPQIDSTFVGGSGVGFYENMQGLDQPIYRVSNDLNGKDYIANTYVKPHLAYYYLREDLGATTFDKALRSYINHWNGKHPQPEDFFNIMNQETGQDLSWFWQRWFFENNDADLAIKTLSKEKDGYRLAIENKGGKPLPVHLVCIYEDSSKQEIHRTVSIWKGGNTVAEITITTKKSLKTVRVESGYVPDKNKADNIAEVR